MTANERALCELSASLIVAYFWLNCLLLIAQAVGNPSRPLRPRVIALVLFFGVPMFAFYLLFARKIDQSPKS